MANVACMLLVAACSKDDQRRPPAAENPDESDIRPGPARPPEPEKPIDLIRRADSYAEAMKVALPLMGDAVDELDTGALLLTAWAAEKMTWTDVAVTRNETSLKLVMKDSDEARGKRMCISGQLVEIQKVSHAPKFFAGGLVVGYQDVYRFLAVGSTGDLVAQSRARFCGVVVGQYAYSNVSGGQTKSMMLVGMFDLPANRPVDPLD